MALETGGYAEKFGNRYEANWVAYLLLQLLEEKVLSVTVEPIGDDEVGVDVIVEHHDGKKEYHQCKSSNGSSEYWSLSKLNTAGILEKAFLQIQRQEVDEFHVVSPLTSKNLSDLCDSTLNSNGNAGDFYQYQIKTSKPRKKNFDDLCGYLGLNASKRSDLEQTMLFLQRFKVVPYVINRHTTCELEDKATALFSDEPGKLLPFLKTYPIELNKLRAKITVSMLLSDLERNGFSPRIKPDDKRITPVIARISHDFSESIRPYLISEALIPRSEMNDVIESFQYHPVTLVKAEAGMGKSALLLALHESLQSQGMISVPIRLDRTRPENSADAFGKKLGFPYSPVLCLSRFSTKQKIIIILDQLDAIRWTASHSNNALQVCQQLVRQVLALSKEGVDINIILACRDFDLDEDVALSSWINGLNDKVAKISLSRLDNDTVTSLIEPFEKFESISDEKQKILTIPLWLSIYLVIAKRIKAAPQFTNKLELVKKFWDDRILKVVFLGVREADAKQLINEIVVLMNRKSRLSVPDNLIAMSSPKTLEALLSVGILTRQSQNISFRHQALFDYRIGIRLFDAALISPAQLISEMGDYSQQTLTKREHLKYALNMLLDYGQSEFCASVQALLASEQVRFHLKYLAYNSIKELTTLKSPAKRMLDCLVKDSERLSSFISNSCYNNHHIINYLSESGVISNWLNSDDNKLIEKTINLLNSISKKYPDTVLKELTPFVGKSEAWNNHIYAGLCFDMVNDSDAMFEVRKSVVGLGCQIRFIDWKVLTKQKPKRALDLVEMFLYHYKEVLCSPRYSLDKKTVKLAYSDNLSESDIDEMKHVSLAIPEEILARLLMIINEFIGNQGDSTIERWLNEGRHLSYDAEDCITTAVCLLVEKAGETLSSHPSTLLNAVKPYLPGNNPVITHLIAKLLSNLPTKYSDLVIEWLLDSPQSRLACGNDYREPKWVLPGKLIEKFSVNCSESLFYKLEQAIYYFGASRSVENIKWMLKARRKGGCYSYSFWGEVQYFLLPKLSLGRVEDKTKQLMVVLNRKFEFSTEEDFHSSSRCRGGIVTSPLPSGNTLSDHAWEKLILAPKDRANNGSWIQRGRDAVSESSIHQFSRSLYNAVKNQPTRFANLALSLPSTINKQYIDGFYYGLAKTDNNNVNEKYRDGWIPCSPKLVEKVIKHFDDTDYRNPLAWLLKDRITEDGWSENAKKWLIDIALNAEDPKQNKLNIGSESAEEANARHLRGTAIHSCRGIAYQGISRLFWEDETLACELKYLVQSAMNDPHPAINIAALDLLLPLLDYDESYALEMFVILCNKDMRMAAGSGTSHFFNNGFEGSHQQGFVDLVLIMLESPRDEIRKEAAKQVFARWFFNDLFEDEIGKIMQGDDIFRQGIASVVSQFLREDKYHDRLHKIPSIYAQLVNDEKEEILRMVGGCIRDGNFWNKPISNELLDLFVSSRAALYCLSDLFDAMEKHSGSLLEYQEPLLRLVENMTSPHNPDKANQGMHIRETSLIKVLQRLYDEATEDEDSNAINVCLDIWDKLLSSEIYSAINASKELDKGLLS